MKYARLVTALVVVFSVGSTALADWDPGDGHKMHFPQLPDLSPNGMDVLATWGLGDPGTQQFGKIVADDWRCSESGPVSDIHIWGSWLYDRLPQGSDAGGIPSAQNVRFKLSIQKNIPAGVDTEMPWSHPGEELWQRIFEVNDPQVAVRQYGPILPIGEEEKFYDPNLAAAGLNPIIGTDRQVWQYNFLLTENAADPLFHQEKDEIYWLDVQADPIDSETQPNEQTLFGWKTSDFYRYPRPWTGRHYEDDAVFGDNIQFGGPPIPFNGHPPWVDMNYPFGHPYETRSFDMAFVITPEPSTLVLAGMALAALAGHGFRRRRKT